MLEKTILKIIHTVRQNTESREKPSDVCIPHPLNPVLPPQLMCYPVSPITVGWMVAEVGTFFPWLPCNCCLTALLETKLKTETSRMWKKYSAGFYTDSKHPRLFHLRLHLTRGSDGRATVRRTHTCHNLETCASHRPAARKEETCTMDAAFHCSTSAAGAESSAVLVRNLSGSNPLL